jgi:ABC-type dipeptide/oligopeptide/nickel transport system permease subunit
MARRRRRHRLASLSGLAIVTAVLGFSLLDHALRDLLGRRLRRR